MDPVSQRWLEVAKLIEKNKTAIVACPQCTIGTLLVKDEPIPAWEKTDRYIICYNCGAHNVMTGDFPDSASYIPEENNG